jgi:hypothetical protein
MLVRPNDGEWATKNPNKSDRAIAAEIGIEASTDFPIKRKCAQNSSRSTAASAVPRLIPN